MKRSFQWLSALALMVMGALAFVACSSNDSGGGVPDNSKILGTWIIAEVSPSNGPDVGEEMTFKSDGTFIVGKDQGTYTYNSETGDFKAWMNNMTMSGKFTLNGDVATGTVNVTSGGQTQTYNMKMNRRGDGEDEITVSCTKMVGTWKVMIDEGNETNVHQIVTFDEQGYCKIGEKYYTYTCEENEDGSFEFEVFDNGGEGVIQGTMVLVNAGNVLNGQYFPVLSSEAKTRDAHVSYALVMKNPDYIYPTEGVKGRWQFTFVAQASNIYNEYFAERLPMAERGEVFVIDEDGGLYVEGEPAVGYYTWGTPHANSLYLFFAGKYGEMTYRVGGLIEFSDFGDTMTIPQGRGTLAINQSSAAGFNGTIERAEFKGETLEDNRDAVKDKRILGSWYVTMDEGTMYWGGSTFTFYADGTWTGGWMNGYFSSEVDEEDARRICFKLYSDERELRMDGKLVKVSGGNVLTGDYSFPNGEKAKTRGDDGGNPHFGIAMKKPGYEYPFDNGIKGRWKMTECSLGDKAPIGNVLVFENDGELYIEGDPHVDSYTVTYTVRDGQMNADVVMTFDKGPIITGTVVISGTTGSLINATAKMGNETISGVTAMLVKPSIDK